MRIAAAAYGAVWFVTPQLLSRELFPPSSCSPEFESAPSFSVSVCLSLSLHVFCPRLLLVPAPPNVLLRVHRVLGTLGAHRVLGSHTVGLSAHCQLRCHCPLPSATLSVLLSATVAKCPFLLVSLLVHR
jgi:hypothetical protein